MALHCMAHTIQHARRYAPPGFPEVMCHAAAHYLSFFQVQTKCQKEINQIVIMPPAAVDMWPRVDRNKSATMPQHPGTWEPLSLGLMSFHDPGLFRQGLCP